jgi:mycofactocin precursor
MRPSDEIDPVGVDPAAPSGAGHDEPEELLVEEISIDGMCGVY